MKLFRKVKALSIGDRKNNNRESISADEVGSLLMVLFNN